MIHPFDLVAIFLFISFGIIGYKRGFLEEAGRLIGLIVSSIAGFKFYYSLAAIIYEKLPLDWRLIIFIAFSIIFFTTLFIARVLTRFVQMFLLAKGVKSINRIMGIAIGSLKASVVAILLCWIIDIIPNSEHMITMKIQSYVYHNSSGIRNWLIDIYHLDEPIEKGKVWVKEKIES
ncbi:MAG: hypothetical protein CMG75_00040 [Candidatus Marinimicrobia bacterium]|nr:hypothetical protein [Candidatus Neomarinimicrobiota bacterium]